MRWYVYARRLQGCSGLEGKRLVGAVLVSVLAVLLLASCGSGGDEATEEEGPALETVLGTEDNGSQVDLGLGQSLVVALASNPATGYSWQVVEGPGPALVQVGAVEYRQEAAGEEPQVGAGGTEVFRFQAKADGQTTLTLEYRRPWEKGVEPLETFSVQVTVR